MNPVTLVGIANILSAMLSPSYPQQRDYDLLRRILWDDPVWDAKNVIYSEIKSEAA